MNIDYIEWQVSESTYLCCVSMARDESAPHAGSALGGAAGATDCRVLHPGPRWHMLCPPAPRAGHAGAHTLKQLDIYM